ncbi:MAG: phosphoadenosine phosphosulfate reductase family protein [Tannerellaceae bacterium]|jgi:3'-phosphoadenosine 5'-phosphosulfate sulfotransferase (PAPS reductase)/FAD synthetase|nr:phosphoadenosine phosphosulfate reductase family protein [Tannerellaceae bacterium]
MNIYQKIDLICERLEGFRLYNPSLSKLSYSGGRDSHLLLFIIRNILKYNNEQYPAIYAKTHNEFEEIRHRIEEQDITIVDNHRRVFEIFRAEGLPLFGKQFSKYFNDVHVKHWNIQLTNERIKEDFENRCEWAISCGLCLSEKCCALLKEDILKKHKSRIVGIRREEGGRRSTGRSAEYDFCVKNSKVLFKPIFDITRSELGEMEKALKIDPLNIYNYLDRTGCVMCGFGTKKQIAEKINYLRWYEPSRAKFYIEYFKEYLKYRKIKF